MELQCICNWEIPLKEIWAKERNGAFGSDKLGWCVRDCSGKPAAERGLVTESLTRRGTPRRLCLFIGDFDFTRYYKLEQDALMFWGVLVDEIQKTVNYFLGEMF